MINEVRNTVLALLNKNNNGYLTPEEFNLLAKQAQLEIYEAYFYNYNDWLNKRNARVSNSESADIARGYIEVIDGFREPNVELTKGLLGNGYFELPNNWYTVDDVYLDPTGLGVNFESFIQADRVSTTKASRLLRSNLTLPTVEYPIYFMAEDTNNPQPGNTTESGIKFYPIFLSDGVTPVTTGNVYINYVRYPLDPKWTYQSIGANGDPIFDPNQPDYQDFEIPLADFIGLVIKILEYSGLVIREQEVMAFANAEDMEITQQDNS